VLLPETYVTDLQVRLGLYRRLSGLTARDEIDAFGSELVDRFGPLPSEVEHLLDVVEIKALCRQAGVATLDAGPRGASVGFRKGQFANPDGLVKLIAASKGMVKVQPDMKLVFKADWEQEAARMKGARGLVAELARIATGA
jgi:transcription-repair coupling factor (superfamily II helicase)